MVNQDSKAAARKVLEEVFPADDETALANLIDDGFINHEVLAGTPPGLGSVTYFMHMLAKAFSDQRWTIHHTLADGDLVAVHCTHSGRHTGDAIFGIPASGRSFSYRQMHMLRFIGGKAAEHWAIRDDASLLRQLTGSLPAQPQGTRAAPSCA